MNTPAGSDVKRSSGVGQQSLFDLVVITGQPSVTPWVNEQHFSTGRCIAKSRPGICGKPHDGSEQRGNYRFSGFCVTESLVR
ncbi:Protein of unknown function [Pyronema omphalodes CBS 100304]|uniref:Uncharacterized protein n=1 Tax=Pyronema omphalodes (strain CBS 100304) TaxID=1076935 RepID=U4KYM5_PYROM|nr:Protein of unknown function [Pyronema omphalodes CBS 100304]